MVWIGGQYKMYKSIIFINLSTDIKIYVVSLGDNTARTPHIFGHSLSGRQKSNCYEGYKYLLWNPVCYHILWVMPPTLEVRSNLTLPYVDCFCLTLILALKQMHHIRPFMKILIINPIQKAGPTDAKFGFSHWVKSPLLGLTFTVSYIFCL